ncbi:MAG: LCP family protein, partial [Anaerovoracaceae bacterium]
MGNRKTKHSKSSGTIFASHNKYEGKNIFKKMGSWFCGLKKWQKALLITVIVLIIFAAAAYGVINGKLNQMNKVDVDETTLSIVDVNGYANILLLGVDTRDMDNIKGSRSDAIMIISINEKTKDVKLVSVYRDTFLKMGDTTTYDKITHACVYGGPEMTVKSLNQAMDLNISKFVVVNFKAVADLVDAVGGIDVDVQDYEIQQLNKYTIQTADNIGKKKYKLVKAAGMQNIEGVQAVSYGRIRKGVGDDFKRTERMRIVLTKVFEKIKVMSVGELNDISNLMLPQVQTNLGNNDIIALALRAATYKIGSSAGWPYDVTGGTLNGVSYVFPNDLETNIVKLHKEIFGQLEYTASSSGIAISNEIQARIALGKQQESFVEKKPVKKDPVVPEKPKPPVDPGEVDPVEPPVEPPVDPVEPPVT